MDTPDIIGGHDSGTPQPDIMESGAVQLRNKSGGQGSIIRELLEHGFVVREIHDSGFYVGKMKDEISENLNRLSTEGGTE